MINYLGCLSLSNHPQVPQKSINYLNDMIRTQAVVIYQPNVLATTAIYLATRDCGIEMPEDWHLVFDTQFTDISVVASLLDHLYKNPPKMEIPIKIF